MCLHWYTVLVSAVPSIFVLVQGIGIVAPFVSFWNRGWKVVAAPGDEGNQVHRWLVSMPFSNRFFLHWTALFSLHLPRRARARARAQQKKRVILEAHQTRPLALEPDAAPAQKLPP